MLRASLKYQFNNAFTARKLRNWEVSKCYYPSRPRPRKGFTKIISDERGHLLPEVARPKTNPWGRFKNTWQLPDKLTKQEAFEISNNLAGFRGSKQKNLQDLNSKAKEQITSLPFYQPHQMPAFNQPPQFQIQPQDMQNFVFPIQNSNLSEMPNYHYSSGMINPQMCGGFPQNQFGSQFHSQDLPMNGLQQFYDGFHPKLMQNFEVPMPTQMMNGCDSQLIGGTENQGIPAQFPSQFMHSAVQEYWQPS